MYCKSLIIIGIFLLFVWGFKNASYHLLTTGAPASSTGAPGENNCTASGCHDDNPLNAGNAVTQISFDGVNSEYVSGNRYTITVSIEEPNTNRFGFELVAINDYDLSNAGTFEITDSVRTQIIPGIPGLEDRRYITYRFYGTTPNFPGKSEWAVDWIAPNTGNSSVTFYIAAISANNDGTDKGDMAFTTALTVYLDPTTSIYSDYGDETELISLYPDPVSDRALVGFNLFSKGYVKIDVYNYLGRRVERIFEGFHASGAHQHEYSFDSYKPGIYFIVLNIDEKPSLKKFIILDE